MMSEAQADMVLVEAGNLPVVPDTGLEDMELGDKNLGECTRLGDPGAGVKLDIE